MKGNARTVNPVVLHREITTCFTVTKEEAQKKKKAADSRAGFQLKRKKKSQSTDPSWRKRQIQCGLCFSEQGFLSEAGLFFLSLPFCSSKRSAGRINRTHDVSALPPSQQRRVCLTCVSLLRRKRDAPSVNVDAGREVRSTWRRIKVGGCAAWCSPSCCCGAMRSPVHMRYRLRIFSPPTTVGGASRSEGM